jgi:hypothetical protein
LRPFLAKRLRPFWIVPNIGFLQFAVDLIQPLALGLEVKDTP